MDKNLEYNNFSRRGSCWFNQHKYMRIAFRYWDLPDNRLIFNGFRCCKPCSHTKQIKQWQKETEDGLF